MRAPRRVPVAMALLLALVTAVSGCAAPEASPPSTITAPVDPKFIFGTDRGPIDQLAAASVTDLRNYWSQQFPRTFDTAWRPLDGGFFSVDTTDPDGPPPPCSATASDVEGNAYFCVSVDAIAWDRAALLPVVRERYGDAAVVTVLAHEFGHAVQQRTGVHVLGSKQPLVIESMADCYAGSYLRWVIDGRSAHLRLDPEQLTGAMRALITFRDPLGTSSADHNAHGTAFDRISALYNGYQQGPGRCRQITSEPDRDFAGRELTGRPEHHRPLPDWIGTAGEDARRWFRDLTIRRGARWTDPALTTSGTPCARGRQGAVSLCPGKIVVDRARLAEAHDSIGDHATAGLLASRYALATVGALGHPTRGPRAGTAATCLTGAYLGTRFGRPVAGAPLSPGDLDEAVEVVLTDDQVRRDSDGRATGSGLDRFGAFRTGLLHGPDACAP